MLKMNSIIYTICFCLVILQLGAAWFQWNYDTRWSDLSASDVKVKMDLWYETWGKNATKGAVNPNNAPRPRRGHSLVLVRTQADSKLMGATYIVMFGGRDNDGKFEHIPKTYNVEKINGTISFTTYDQKPVLACNDFEGKYYSEKDRESCSNDRRTALIDVGIIYNDVWAYKLCQVNNPNDPTVDAHRYFNGPCEDSGWVIWHPGAAEGGCVIELGIEVCNVPSERYNHAAVMFHDGCMYVYGGFSQRCVDYCDDIWFFDIYVRGWRQVYGANDLTYLKQEIFSFNLIDPYEYSDEEVPRDTAENPHSGPSRRWRHSMVISKVHNETNPPFNCPFKLKQTAAVFGGHRLWHGFSLENSEMNNWDLYESRPLGGYLDDLWLYTKWLDFDTLPGETFKKNDGLWRKVPPKEECYSSPGVSWESRDDTTCIVVWPPGRAGHGSVYDDKRNLIWIFGGYHTYFPYLSTDGPGSGEGVSSLGFGGFVPYPGYSYFLNDLWYYNLSSGYWKEVKVPDGTPVPRPRSEMVLLLLYDELFLHGGFADNNYFDDTWYFNITAGVWLEKKKHVYPIYPKSCSDDLEYIASHPDCIHMSWPKHLARDRNSPFKILPYDKQPGYWANSGHGEYWDIQQKGFNATRDANKLVKAADGTPLFPNASTGPLQYAREYLYYFNATHVGRIVESCTSVLAETTRGTVLDGKGGRSNSSVFIAQPRRQRPGWDGCRDRIDGRKDMVQELQYVKPYPRANHKAVFYPDYNEIFMYGGIGYFSENPIVYDDTYASNAKDEMWYFNLFHCNNNCSLHGSCYYGFCLCDVGYYGEDCSNSSCPGTSCFYTDAHDQVCYHACSAGYEHTDNETYVLDAAKLPCTEDRPGYSHGVCDGFGHSMCAPPFIGDDCSIRDCRDNCSFNGWCSVEYPVSRCVCMPGYFGDICQHKLCLNNCSFPNGLCNTTSGECMCRMMYSPYNNSRPYKPWDGEDCSYQFPYAAATLSLNLFGVQLRPTGSLMLALVVLVPSIITVFLQGIAFIEEDSGPGKGT